MGICSPLWGVRGGILVEDWGILAYFWQEKD